jgi:hypothetical protein
MQVNAERLKAAESNAGERRELRLRTSRGAKRRDRYLIMAVRLNGEVQEEGSVESKAKVCSDA